LVRRHLVGFTLAVIGVFGLWASATAAASTPDINLLSVPSANAGLTGITQGPDGNLWFTEKNTYKIGELSTAGQMTEYPVADGTPGVSSTGPTEIVTGSDGELWFLTDIGERADRISTAGAVSTAFFDVDYPAITLSWGDGGSAWLFEAHGDADDDDVIHVVPAGTGGFTSLEGVSDQGVSNDLNAIGTAPDGTAWFSTNRTAGAYLNSITDAGSVETFPLSLPLITQQPASIAFDANGTPWYTAYYEGAFDGGGAGDGLVGELTASGAVNFPVGPQGYEQGMLVNDIVAGPDGAMWFSFTQAYADGYNGIGRITGSGQMQLLNTGGDAPNALAFGGDGNLYFIDSAANSIGKITVTPTLFDTGASTPTPGTPPPAPPTPGAPAPGAPTSAQARLAKPALAVTSENLVKLESARTLAVTCKLSAAGRCAVTASVSAAEARTLGLKVARKAKTVKLASASGTLRKPGTAKLRLRLGPTPARHLRRFKTLALTLTATASAKGAKTVSSSRTVKLKR
jgi:streptogramin lyase